MEVQCYLLILVSPIQLYVYICINNTISFTVIYYKIMMYHSRTQITGTLTPLYTLREIIADIHKRDSYLQYHGHRSAKDKMASLYETQSALLTLCDVDFPRNRSIMGSSGIVVVVTMKYFLISRWFDTQWFYVMSSKRIIFCNQIDNNTREYGLCSQQLMTTRMQQFDTPKINLC